MTIYQLEDIDVILRRLEDGEGEQIGVAAAAGNAVAFTAMTRYEDMLRQPTDPWNAFRFMMAYAKWKDAIMPGT